MVYGCAYLETPGCGHNKQSQFSALFGVNVNFPDKQQIQRVSFWTGVAILFAAPLEVFNLLLEFLHVLFEWTEASLDFIIELLFDSSLHKTQIVVFYIIIAGILYGLYQLWRRFPAFYDRQKKNLLEFLSDERESIEVYWQESDINKIKLFTATAGLIFLLFI
jgi:hypothetical protein